MQLPKLNLRDLFWLIVVVGLALAWWLDHQNPRESPQTGRWELVVGKNGEQIMVDTLTGTAWDYQPHNDTWFKRSKPGGP